MTNAPTLYDQDFVAWTKEQAAGLRAAARTGNNRALDWENLAEEVEDLGRAVRYELRSQLTRIIRHLLKLQQSSAREPRLGWKESIREARSEIEDLLSDNPSLRRDLNRLVAEQVPRAAKLAIADLEDYGELDPSRRELLRSASYTAGEILGDWFPPEPIRPEPDSAARPRSRRR